MINRQLLMANSTLCHEMKTNSWTAAGQARHIVKKGKRKVQEVLQSQAAALPRHEEEEETEKTNQA